jgi:MFS family permease
MQYSTKIKREGGPREANPDDKMHAPQASRATALVTMLVAMMAFSLFFRSTVGTLAPMLRGDIGLDARMLGLANGGFFAAFLVMQLPLGVMFDRYGVRRCVIGLTWLAALGSLIGAFCLEPWSFVGSRILLGVGSAGYFMGSLVIAGNWFRGAQFVSTVSLIYGLSVIGPLAATAPLSSAAELFGWRPVFVAIAAATVALGVGLQIFVRDFPAGSEPRSPAPPPAAGMFAGWREVWRTPGLVPVLAMAAVAYPAGSTLFGTWAAPYLADVHHLGPNVRGELLLLFAATLALGVMGWGQLAARRAGTRSVIVGCSLGAATVLGAFALWPDPPLWLAIVFFTAFCVLTSFSSLVLIEARQLFPQPIAGRGTTTVNLAQSGGAAILPIITGLIIGWAPAPDGSGSALAYRIAFGTIAVLVLAGLAAYRFLPRAGKGPG